MSYLLMQFELPNNPKHISRHSISLNSTISKSSIINCRNCLTFTQLKHKYKQVSGTLRHIHLQTRTHTHSQTHTRAYLTSLLLLRRKFIFPAYQKLFLTVHNMVVSYYLGTKSYVHGFGPILTHWLTFNSVRLTARWAKRVLKNRIENEIKNVPALNLVYFKITFSQSFLTLRNKAKQNDYN